MEDLTKPILEPLILITGHRKGGTTMFQNLFDGHDQVCCYPKDLTILYAYFPQFIREHDKESELLERLDTIVCKFLSDEVEKRKVKMDVGKFRRLFFEDLQDKNIKDPKIVIMAMVKAWQSLMSQSDKKWTILKETSAEVYATELFKWFPNLRIIQLVRDPRDNFAALKVGVESYYSQFGEGDMETLASLIHRALLDMRLAKLNMERYGPNRYLVIRFEDLVSSTEKTMREVASFLNINYDASLLTPSVFGQKTEGNNFEKEKMYSISNKNIDRWSERITAWEAQVIEFYFKEIMTEFKYNCKYTNEEHLDAISKYYKWSNYKYHYNDSFSSSLSQ